MFKFSALFSETDIQAEFNARYSVAAEKLSWDKGRCRDNTQRDLFVNELLDLYQAIPLTLDKARMTGKGVLPKSLEYQLLRTLPAAMSEFPFPDNVEVFIYRVDVPYEGDSSLWRRRPRMSFDGILCADYETAQNTLTFIVWSRDELGLSEAISTFVEKIESVMLSQSQELVKGNEWLRCQLIKHANEVASSLEAVEKMQIATGLPLIQNKLMPNFRALELKKKHK